jgi:predicted ATPase
MIEELYIHNFRCFENFKLDLRKHQSCLLIGKNGTGKSTVLHALDVLRELCNDTGTLGKLIQEGDFTQGRTNVPITFRISLKLKERSFRYRILFDFPERFSQARIVEEELVVNERIVFSREKADVSLPNGTTFGLDWHVPVLRVINGNPNEPAIREVKEFLGTMILVNPIPDLMSSVDSGTGFAPDGLHSLETNASNFVSLLNDLLVKTPEVYPVLKDYVSQFIPELDAFHNKRLGEYSKQLSVSFRKENTQEKRFSLSFDQLSSGEKCFFLSGLIVAANTVGPGVFCLWDEPDNHLSIDEVGHFVLGLRRMSNHNKGQLLVTSHHSETIRKFSDDNTLVLKRASRFEPTTVGPLSELKYDGDLIDALIRGEIIA